MHLQDCLYLGNIDAKRDWGHAKDYVEMQWLMLQQDKPEDFTISTGEQHSVREFIEVSAREVDIKIKWKGQGVDEVGIDSETNNIIIRIDKLFLNFSSYSYLIVRRTIIFICLF